MNKRIKKKRARMSPLRIVNNVYTRDAIKIIIQNNLLRCLISMMRSTSLDPNKSNVCVWRRNNIKRALKYMYNRRNHRYLSYKHLKFARHLKPKDEFILQKPPAIITEHRTIPGGEHWGYKADTTVIDELGNG